MLLFFLGGDVLDRNTNEKLQEIRLIHRKKLDISGVQEVIRFDDNFALLKTICGELNIEGKNIKIGILDTEKGMVSLDGEIDSIYYVDEIKNEKSGFFSKLFS